MWWWSALHRILWRNGRSLCLSEDCLVRFLVSASVNLSLWWPMAGVHSHCALLVNGLNIRARGTLKVLRVKGLVTFRVWIPVKLIPGQQVAALISWRELVHKLRNFWESGESGNFFITRNLNELSPSREWLRRTKELFSPPPAFLSRTGYPANPKCD